MTAPHMRSDLQPVRIGIIGCGNVLSAYWPVAEKLKYRGLAEVVAACGREKQRDLVINQLRIGKFTTDYRELIDTAEIDLVVILTSMNEHGPITRASLEAGKHVLVEKPLA